MKTSCKYLYYNWFWEDFKIPHIYRQEKHSDVNLHGHSKIAWYAQDDNQLHCTGFNLYYTSILHVIFLFVQL